MKKYLYKLLLCFTALVTLFSFTDFSAVAATSVPEKISVSVSNSSEGIKIKWKKVKKASCYRIYKKSTKSGKWKKLTDIKGTVYTDSAVKNAKFYYYKVRPYKGKKKRSMKESAEYVKKYVSVPKITYADEYGKSVTIKYKKIKKAGKYIIYRRTGKSGSFKKIGTTKELFYEDFTTSTGKSYYYKVSAVNGKYKSAKSKSSQSVKSQYYTGECARSEHRLYTYEEVVKPTPVLYGYTLQRCKCGLKTMLTNFKKPTGTTLPDGDAPAYAEAAKRNEASVKYLNEVMTKNRNNLLQVVFGTEDNIRYLKARTDEICQGCKTDYAKAQAIFDWLTNNLEFGDDSPYSTDVIKIKKARCLGFSNLMVDMLRLEGICSAVISGFRGDNKTLLTENNIRTVKNDEGHDWVRFYADGRWVFSDPTWGYFDPDSETLDIPEFYYTIASDYAVPYYKNMNIKLTRNFPVYIDGRYYLFNEDGTQNFSGGVIHFINGGFQLDFDSVADSAQPKSEKDKIILSNPINSDYVYRNGEIVHGLYFSGDGMNLKDKYFRGCYLYNGLKVNQTDYSKNGTNYILFPFGCDFTYSNYSGSALNSYAGRISLMVNDTIRLQPTKSPDKDLFIAKKWVSSNPDVISVDQNGNLKALKVGYSFIELHFDSWSDDRTYKNHDCYTVIIYVNDDSLKINADGIAPYNSISLQRSEIYKILPY